MKVQLLRKLAIPSNLYRKADTRLKSHFSKSVLLCHLQPLLNRYYSHIILHNKGRLGICASHGDVDTKIYSRTNVFCHA